MSKSFKIGVVVGSGLTYTLTSILDSLGYDVTTISVIPQNKKKFGQLLEQITHLFVGEIHSNSFIDTKALTNFVNSGGHIFYFMGWNDINIVNSLDWNILLKQIKYGYVKVKPSKTVRELLNEVTTLNWENCPTFSYCFEVQNLPKSWNILLTSSNAKKKIPILIKRQAEKIRGNIFLMLTTIIIPGGTEFMFWSGFIPFLNTVIRNTGICKDSINYHNISMKDDQKKYVKRLGEALVKVITEDRLIEGFNALVSLNETFSV